MLPFFGGGGGGIGGGGNESGFWFESMGRWERLGCNQGISKTNMAVLWERPIFIVDSNSWIANFSSEPHFFFLIPYMPLCQIPITHHQHPW